jgi:DNA helicase-2/ATP-dependent DNA helicase PcrA
VDGAGSGKTYTLTKILNYIYNKDKNATVACITYTNVAADEIKNRSPFTTLKSSTIHNFLWDIIKGYQKNIKIALKSNIIDLKNEIKDTDIDSLKEIKYREYKKLSEGIISHDEVLKISNFLFSEYPLLSKILSDKYQYIFIDEYQDTQRSVIEIFFDYFIKNSNDKTVIGLFGDKVQSIYPNGIGDVEKYIKDSIIIEIQKKDNYRCSKQVIELLNKIRDDDIKQNASGENLNVEGSIKFIYSEDANMKIVDIEKNSVFNNWNFTDYANNKKLCLTHRLISKEFEFNKVFEIFFEEYKGLTTNMLFGDDKDKFINHLLRIQELIVLYKDKQYNKLINKISCKINKLEDKKNIRGTFNKLLEKISENNIEEIYKLIEEKKLVIKDDSLEMWMRDKSDLFEKVKVIPYNEIINLYNYNNSLSPFSTQHGVKGAEYKNVFVLLDNAGWNLYNFSTIFDDYNYKGQKGIPNTTQKLFYVCCSRAKENLVVYYANPSQEIISKAKEYFGENNLIKI